MVDKLRQLGAKHRSFELGTGDRNHGGGRSSTPGTSWNHGAGMNLGADKDQAPG